MRRMLLRTPHASLLFGACALLATLGTSQTIASGIWDAVSHMLGEPDEFWTIQHITVYAGVALVALSAVISYILLIWRRDSLNTPQKRALVLVIAGAMLQIISGYADSISHDVYGIDGLVSWSHQPLEAGLVISALGALLLLRSASPRIKSLAPIASCVFVFASIWLVFNITLIFGSHIMCLAVYRVFSSGCSVM